jgi:hypothetical protein
MMEITAKVNDIWWTLPVAGLVVPDLLVTAKKAS